MSVAGPGIESECLTLPVHGHIQILDGAVATKYLPQVSFVDVLGEFLNDNLSTVSFNRTRITNHHATFELLGICGLLLPERLLE